MTISNRVPKDHSLAARCPGPDARNAERQLWPIALSHQDLLAEAELHRFHGRGWLLTAAAPKRPTTIGANDMAEPVLFAWPESPHRCALRMAKDSYFIDLTVGRKR